MNVTADSPRVEDVVSARQQVAGYAVWTLLLLAFAVAPFAVAYVTARQFNGSAIDGPFQLYNALRRIQAGFRPGVDFQFFHGLGMAYLHYLPYRLFGGGLPGSELARELLSVVSYPFVFLLVFRVFVREWRRVLAFAAAGMALTFLLKMSALLFAQNGMLGLRAALPTMIPAIVLSVNDRRLRIAAVGTSLGFSLFLSTEQGLAALSAYLVVSLIVLIRDRARATAAIELVSTVAVAVSVLVACLLSIGGVAGMRGALRYNFRLVPMDQYWYFGSPPNPFVPSWSAGARMVLATPIIASALVLSLFAAAVYIARLWNNAGGDASGEIGRRKFALALFPVYGLISCVSLLGAFIPAYVQPCWRVLLILALIEACAWSDQRAARGESTRDEFGVPRLLALGILIACGLTVLMVPLVRVALATSLPQLLTRDANAPRFPIDSMWSMTLQQGQLEVDRHRGPGGTPPTMWSTYAGWIEARNGIFHPSFDYIIHALGAENRAAYVTTFRATQPVLVQTVLPSYTQYETWIENTEWAFYDEVLRNYKVSSLTPWSIFWDRRAAPAAEPRLVQTIEVPAGANTVSLAAIPATAPVRVLLEVEVDYETRSPLHVLPVIGNIPRFLVGVRGAYSLTPISLNPHLTTMRFPLVAGPGQQPVLQFETFSLLPGASLHVRRLRVYVRDIDDGNRAWFMNLCRLLPGGGALD